MRKMFSYKYYDTPEGQDIYKKVFVTSKYAGSAAMVCATYDVLMFSHAKGFAQTASRYAFFVGPMVGMATAFTVTANAAQNIRGKNDGINYFLGGAAAGSIFSAWARSMTIALPAMVFLGTLAVVKKMGVDGGWTFVPDSTLASKSAQSSKHDWTLAKDVTKWKTWTTGKEDSQ